jgi:MFS family permease
VDERYAANETAAYNVKTSGRAAGLAWLLAACFYFYQYALRSAPAVMVPQLSKAFDLSAVGVASLIGMFYYGYSPFSLVAGTALDRFGAKKVIPAGALIAAIGAFLFATGNAAAGNVGRVLQGAGGAFGLVGAVYIASNFFPSSRAATLIGATQIIGMSGGSAGQLLVGPLITAGVAWYDFWLAMGIAAILIAAALVVLLPGKQEEKETNNWIKESFVSLGKVFRNPQSILCGSIAGLVFIPTTIFDMIWGVRYLEEARGFEYADAVIRSATVPVGWIIGCPLLGFISDRIGRRKPVIIAGACVLLACLTWILYGPRDVLPPYVLGLVAGIASGAAMLTYTVAKEANPAHLGGTATGVNSFLNLTFSALVGPVVGNIMESVSQKPLTPIEHYQITFQPLLYGVAIAAILGFLLRETGTAARARVFSAEAA